MERILSGFMAITGAIAICSDNSLYSMLFAIMVVVYACYHLYDNWNTRKRYVYILVFIVALTFFYYVLQLFLKGIFVHTAAFPKWLFLFFRYTFSVSGCP
ncbi:hypothetical protein SAMN06264849_105151 [Melghirimyces algeriensis]|uniref:Uncharacterized protein n=1 Tax=Melghirimyces algeriensis TaxID=910412 RepID=A0A521D7W2_9BACL|nr:hypothetical protein SAMN06264849_105151 [Melghirimyces algeriensis]